MSISSLSRITVPLASDSSASAQGTLMPKLAYRFRVTLENFGVSTPSTELTKQVMDATRPNLTFEPINVAVYNSTVKLAGRHTWEDLTVTIRDDATGQVQKLVGEQLQKQFDFYEQASAVSGQDYKFTTRIEILDGGNGAYAPTVLETWECYGCYVVGADYGALAYETNDVVKIALTISFDNAVQTPQGTGVGTAVGRTVGTMITGGG